MKRTYVNNLILKKLLAHLSPTQLIENTWPKPNPAQLINGQNSLFILYGIKSPKSFLRVGQNLGGIWHHLKTMGDLIRKHFTITKCYAQAESGQLTTSIRF